MIGIVFVGDKNKGKISIPTKTVKRKVRGSYSEIEPYISRLALKHELNKQLGK